MAENTKERWEGPAEQVLELFRTRGPEAAFEYMDRLAGDSGTAEQIGPPPGFREVAAHLYWQQKALPEAVSIWEEIIRRLEEKLCRASTPADENLVRPLGGTCYNLASFAWPGWDEPGITVGPKELDAGRRAAARCLDVRLDPAHAGVSFGYTPSMAHWIVGAYHLVDRCWHQSRLCFAEAARLQRETGEEDLLERGYGCLAGLLEEPDNQAAHSAWNLLLAELASRHGNENAGSYRQQLLTAQRVFTR